jgi:arylsulfatase A-like enzyme
MRIPAEPRARRAARALLGGLACVLAACAPDRSEGGSSAPTSAIARPRGVLLIAVDGLRADRLSTHGYDRTTTPAIARLAAEGASFQQCFSTAPWLLPAHVSLLTGCDPNIARRVIDKNVESEIDRTWYVPAKAPHLAVELLTHSFATAAFVDHPWIEPRLGIAAGFERFDTVQTAAVGADADARSGPPLGLDGRSDALLQWLRSIGRERPWFAYVHTHELERIWAAPDPLRDTLFEPRPGRTQVPPVANVEPVFFAIPPSRWDGGTHSLGEYEARYDGALHVLDRKLERLFDSLRAEERWEDTLVVLVGTHGLQFGEAGLFLDHGALSVFDLRVPWILRAPRASELQQARNYEGVCSTVDVAPTVLALCDVPPRSGMHGFSALAQLRGSDDPLRPFAIATGGLQQGFALFGSAWCFEALYPGAVASPNLATSWYGEQRARGTSPGYTERFYNRFDSPFPGVELDVQPPNEISTRMRTFATRWVVHTDLLRRVMNPTAVGDVPVSAADIELLKQLGYLGEDW